jgi:hypothetical protein
MARFDGIDPERLAFCRQVLKEMLEGMEPPIDRGGHALVLALVLDKLRHVAPGNGARVLGHQREKQAEIPPIIIDGVRRIVPPAQISTEWGNGSRFHPLRSCQSMASGNGGHGLLVLLPFGRIVQLDIA